MWNYLHIFEGSSKRNTHGRDGFSMSDLSKGVHRFMMVLLVSVLLPIDLKGSTTAKFIMRNNTRVMVNSMYLFYLVDDVISDIAE